MLVLTYNNTDNIGKLTIKKDVTYLNFLFNINFIEDRTLLAMFIRNCEGK